ncbi:MBL fold metallo-hydrolase [Candidatus Saccharibacteria bacterium]|nr:MBL fold metallo-hydrolase [Candidatus Saccharibacteria bacterium]
MLKITHLAHAGFLIENDKESLIIDPADNSFGYEYKTETVNYLLVSHNHFDHNNIENIKVEDNVGSFVISKIDSYHDKEQGNLRGTNIIHVIERKILEFAI